jgi:predicted O-methyltransferase YrrM
MYLASALKLNGVGKIVTLEGAEPLASIAIKNFKTLELNNIDLILGKFQDTLENVLVQQKFFDFVFIDGNHDENATIKYFNQIYPYLSEKAIVIFDDISWSQGMKNAWDTIQNDKKVNYAFNLHNIGICLFEPEGVNKSKKLYDMHIT